MARRNPHMKLAFLGANNAYAFVMGESIVRMDGDDLFFRTKADAKDSARRHGLKILPTDDVVSEDGEEHIPVPGKPRKMMGYAGKRMRSNPSSAEGLIKEIKSGRMSIKELALLGSARNTPLEHLTEGQADLVRRRANEAIQGGNYSEMKTRSVAASAAYTYFVWNTKTQLIESGWAFAEDAKSALGEYGSGTPGLKVVTKKGLANKGIDVHDPDNWEGQFDDDNIRNNPGVRTWGRAIITKNLLGSFRGGRWALSTADAKRIVAMKREVTSGRKAEDLLKAAAEMIGAYGVEAIRGGVNAGSYFQDHVALYINTGDTYEPTILYDTVAREMGITTTGDFVEVMGDEYEIS
jgi:hypothetical protein